MRGGGGQTGGLVLNNPGGNRMNERHGVSRRQLLISGGLAATVPLRPRESAENPGTHPDQLAREMAYTSPSAAGASAGAATGAPEEPYLDGDEIQGNVVPGFMKPYMAV